MWCLVTDRRRLSSGDLPVDAACRQLVAHVARAVEAAVDLILVRERDLEAARLAALVSELVSVTRGTGTRVVVNDRTDVALASGADGVHLRGDSVAARAVRRIVPPGFLVGRSVHSVTEAVEAGPVDYLIAGTVFPTPSKPGLVRCLGLDGLAAIVQAVAVPVLAIGGLTEALVDEVAATGSAGVAAIGLFVDRFDRPRASS